VWCLPTNLHQQLSPDNDNETWYVAQLSDNTLFTAYGRPLYGWYGNSSEKFNLTENDSLYMLFSGSRYLGIVFKETRYQDINFWQSAAAGESYIIRHDECQIAPKCYMVCCCHI